MLSDKKKIAQTTNNALEDLPGEILDLGLKDGFLPTIGSITPSECEPVDNALRRICVLHSVDVKDQDNSQAHR